MWTTIEITHTINFSRQNFLETWNGCFPFCKQSSGHILNSQDGSLLIQTPNIFVFCHFTFIMHSCALWAIPTSYSSSFFVVVAVTIPALSLPPPHPPALIHSQENFPGWNVSLWTLRLAWLQVWTALRRIYAQVLFGTASSQWQWTNPSSPAGYRLLWILVQNI